MTDKHQKKIKFALFLKDVEVRTKKDLKKYFDMPKIIGYLFDGKLSQWMRGHDYSLEDCRAVEELRINYNRKVLFLKNVSPENEKILTREIIRELCKIFEINESEVEEVESIEQIKKSSDRKKGILEIAAFEEDEEKEEIRKYINQIVSTQFELDAVIARLKTQKKVGIKYKIVYLLNKDKPYILNEEDVFDTDIRFVGINKQTLPGKTELRIEQQFFGGKHETMEEDQLNILTSKPENRDKFSNLKVVVRKLKGIGSYVDDRKEFPKIRRITSENIGKDDTGIDIATKKLMLYLDAGFPVIYIDTFEEDKADEIIRCVAIERDVYEWNKAEGLFKCNDSGEHVANFDNRMPLKETLQNFINDTRSLQYGASVKCQLNNSILVLKDIHKYFDDEEIVAQIKYLAQLIYNGKLNDCTIIIVSFVLKIPEVLEHYLTVLKIENLNEKEIKNLINNFCQEHGAKIHSEILLKKLVTAFKGMSEFDITNILSLALADENDITFSDLDLIMENKKQIICKTNILEMVECDEKETDIGGLEYLKKWLEKKENVFRHIDEAMRCGVKIPKGILIVGMPGCGKTLTAKATATIFDLPLLKLDMGKILGKYVGESEKNMHRATKLAEVTAPCVLWIDELEKTFATGTDSGEITVRLLGLFLTWMQEKTAPVFVVATANSVESLPPELLRKGRFDEIFYVGTPNAFERKKIFEIHINKVRYNDNFEWRDSEEDKERKLKKLAMSTLGYSGADIAGIVAEAVENSFSEFMKNKRSTTAKNSNEEKKKPEFNFDKVQKVIDTSAKMSAWNQLTRIFGNYKRKKFKNASRTDSNDIFYWINLRFKYLANLPRKILGLIKSIIQVTLEILHDVETEKFKNLKNKVRQWDEEEHKRKTEGLSELPRRKRIYRNVVRKFRDYLERKFGTKENEQKGD